MRILVTGGGGFLGSALAKRLLDRGDAVAVLGRSDYPHLGEGIEIIKADIRDRKAVVQALKERDAVFHTAAVPGIWGDPEIFYGINVDGTRNVIEGCWENSVPRLVHTSTPSVVFGSSDMENADERVPYRSTYLCDYPRTKAIAERLVVEANGVRGLATVCLRPHLIWGPGDPHLVPRILDRARKGSLVRVGDGKNKVDLTYIDNAVKGHIQASDALQRGSPVAGSCYFLSDGNPVVLWEWIDDLLRAMGIATVSRSLSYRRATIIGALLETLYRTFKITREPRMTRFVAAQLAKSHFFDISAARNDFGYAPEVDAEEGMKKLIQSLRDRPEY